MEGDDETLSPVGRKYFFNYKKRNGNKIKSKRGKKYELDRANWVTYLNFNDMYDDIEHLFVEVAKLATWLLEPVWMNKLGEVVLDEMKGSGFKVKIDMHSPDMVIVADEVGGNTSEKDDGHVGGRWTI